MMMTMTRTNDDDTNNDTDNNADFEEHDAKYAPVVSKKDDKIILLGEGNFGQARLMTNKCTGEKVAIKYIPRGKHLDENVVR